MSAPQPTAAPPVASQPETPLSITVLPPRPAAPPIASSSRDSSADVRATQLPSDGITRSGHRFRADAAPFVPGHLQTIIEADDSSSSDDDDDIAASSTATPSAPAKSPMPMASY